MFLKFTVYYTFILLLRILTCLGSFIFHARVSELGGIHDMISLIPLIYNIIIILPPPHPNDFVYVFGTIFSMRLNVLLLIISPTEHFWAYHCIYLFFKSIYTITYLVYFCTPQYLFLNTRSCDCQHTFIILIILY